LPYLPHIRGDPESGRITPGHSFRWRLAKVRSSDAKAPQRLPVAFAATYLLKITF